MRKIARTDANQTAIMDALRRVGALVHSTAQLGGGFPDIIVGHRRRLYMMEIKDGTKKPSAQKLTSDEEKFHALWWDYVYTVNSPEAAIKILFPDNRSNHET